MAQDSRNLCWDGQRFAPVSGVKVTQKLDFRKARAVFRGPVFSLASQVSGLLQLGALLFRYGASNATDAYFYLFNLGNLPTQILTVGVLYPMLLNADRIRSTSARRFGIWVPVAALVAVGFGAGWLALTGRVNSDLVPILVLSGTNAVVQARLWYLAVAAEAGGTAKWISAIALPANILAAGVMLIPWGSSSATVTAMMAALTGANVCFCIFMVRRGVGRQVLDNLPAVAARKHRAHAWFFAKSGTAYGGLMVIQSLTLALPPSTLTLLTVPMKIVASVSATFVNAVMPVLVHQDSDSPTSARKFLRILALLIGALGGAGAIASSFLFPNFAVIGFVVALWLVASALAAVSQRMAFRFLRPSASRVTIIVVPLVVIAVAFSLHANSFGIVGLLCAYALVDATSGLLLLITLRDGWMALVSGTITATLIVVWITSLHLWV